MTGCVIGGILGMQWADTVIEDNIAVGIITVEITLDPLEDHAACIVVYCGQEEREYGR